MQVGVNPLNSEIFFKKLRKPLDAGVNRPVDGSQDAFVLAVRFMVLHDEHQNVVNVDLHLPDEFNFERNIIVDVFFVPIRFRAIRLIKIEIHALVILKIPLREKFVPGKLVKCA
jgi:hypothetical protein